MIDGDYSLFVVFQNYEIDGEVFQTTYFFWYILINFLPRNEIMRILIHLQIFISIPPFCNGRFIFRVLEIICKSKSVWKSALAFYFLLQFTLLSSHIPASLYLGPPFLFVFQLGYSELSSDKACFPRFNIFVTGINFRLSQSSEDVDSKGAFLFKSKHPAKPFKNDTLFVVRTSFHCVNKGCTICGGLTFFFCLRMWINENEKIQNV